MKIVILQIFDIHFTRFIIKIAFLFILLQTNVSLADINNSLHNPSTFTFPTDIFNNAGEISVDTSALSPTGQTPILDLSQAGGGSSTAVNGTDAGSIGVPIINITNPTSGGVSVNNFTNFNVGTDGLVFNNSINYGTSILGGAIYGNPNFSAGGNTAGIILNQVTGTHTTNLFGFSEIFGNKAELVIANPYGITCSGCGFINTGKISLVAGTAQLQSDLSTIKMNTDVYNSSTGQGIIKIDGINTTGSSGLSLDTSPISLIERSIQIARQLKTSGNIQMIVGKNQITYAAGDSTFHTIDSSTQPTGNQTTVSLDTYNLGGIYGNTIFIESTENGAGVNFAPEVIAQDSMTLDTHGNIYYNDLRSKGDMNLSTSQNIQDIQISTDSTTGAKTKSSTTPTASFSWIDSIGNTYNTNLRISNNSQAYSEGNINITANNATNSGLIYAKGDINYNVANNVLNDYGTIYSESNILSNNLNNTSNTITNGINTNNFSHSFTNHMGYIQAGNDITIKANTIANDREGARQNLWTGIPDSHPGVIGSTITKHIYYDEEQDYRQSYLIADHNLNLSALTITNHGSKLSAGNDANITANTLNNASQVLQDDYNNYYMSWEVVKKKSWFTSGKLKTQYIYGWVPRNYWTYGYRYDSAQILAGNNINLNVTTTLNNGTSAGHQDYSKIIDTSISQTIAASSGTSSVSNGISEGSATVDGVDQDPDPTATHTLIDPLGDPNDPNNWADDTSTTTVNSGDPATNPANAGTNSYNTTSIAENSSSPSTTRPITNINNILYDTNGALFKAADSTSHYVIESKFANVSEFKGAEYLFSRLNIGYYDQELQDRRLMGDSYYEAMTIKTEYERLTNAQFNTETKDLSSKMQTLLDNAYNQKTDLNLTLGVNLSADQTKNLKSDIIWYVNTDIINAQGVKETVLVPQLYLANNNNIVLKEDGTITTNKTISSVISANKDVNINNTDNTNNSLLLNNLGQIKANNGNVNITANSLTNYGITKNNGLIEAITNNTSSQTNGNININLENSLYSLSGVIKGDNDVNIIAGGGILSETLTKRTYMDVGFDREKRSAQNGFEGRDYFDTLGQSSLIQSGNDINITSKGNTVLIGSILTSGNDTNVETGGGFIMKSQILESKKTSISGSHGGGPFGKKTTEFNLDYNLKNVGSNIESGNNLSIKSNLNDKKSSGILIQGSNINTTNNASLLTSNSDITITSTEDRNIQIYQKETVQRDALAFTISVAAATGAAVATGGASTAVMAAGASAGAMGGMNYEKGSLLTRTTDKTTQISSNIFTNNLDIKANNVFNLASSNLTTNNDLTITAKEFNQKDKDNTTIITQTEEKYKPNYIGVAAKAGIDGAMAGFMAEPDKTSPVMKNGKQETNMFGEPKYKSNGDLYSEKAGLGGVNNFIQGIKLDWALNPVGTPVNALTSLGSEKLVDSVIGLETRSKSESKSTVSQKVDSKITTGGKSDIVLID